MTQTQLLAIDLGAESGRTILGKFNGKSLSLHEVSRFPNIPVSAPSGLHWDVLRLWYEIQQGISKAVVENGRFQSIGVDTWGVDFGLLDKNGALLSNPVHYRDNRTVGVPDKLFAQVPWKDVFQQTGIQFMRINTLYQLYSLVLAQSPLLEIAHTFLTMPDLLNYWLTGQKACEFSITTTTQCFNPKTGDWAKDMLAKLQIPTHIFPTIVQPGTNLGSIQASVAESTGINDVAVIAPACHDTGSAVAAVPASGDAFAWISSGTWSIMGVNAPEAIVNDASLAANFTNEGGVDGTYRFSKNVMGLWIVQECRREWARQGEDLDYPTLTQMAHNAKPFTAVVDPNHASFIEPGDMPARVRAFCQETGQPVPQSKGEIIRTVLEGLALKYRSVLDTLEKLNGRSLSTIHIVGGGTQNELLNQFTADACNRPVITGPIEATAVGNMLIQLVASGDLANWDEARELVRRSFPVKTFEPQANTTWDEAYEKLLTLEQRTDQQGI